MKKISRIEELSNENSIRLIKDYNISIDELVDNCEGINTFLYEKIFSDRVEWKSHPLNYFSQISRKLLFGAVILYEASEGKNFYICSEDKLSFVDGSSKIIENFRAAAYYEKLAKDLSNFQEKYIRELLSYKNSRKKRDS